ncbi:hypothetical protein NDU88_000784 [Pleurodeles waltl]|uniref:Uncharacterized protein n=1 Tax=Pleurodeles waltl TaxID=8319 RepID=A0AAV7LB47_PLEWA|nr:hypothetical protein NDU88_000784 [Pleurodeles waltl]
MREVQSRAGPMVRVQPNSSQAYLRSALIEVRARQDLWRCRGGLTSLAHIALGWSSRRVSHFAHEEADQIGNRGRGQVSRDGAHLKPSLRRGRLESRAEACHLRADSGSTESAELGAGLGAAVPLLRLREEFLAGTGPAGRRGTGRLAL